MIKKKKKKTESVLQMLNSVSLLKTKQPVSHMQTQTPPLLQERHYYIILYTVR